MDLNKLTKSDKIVAGGALVFIIGYFMNWFSEGGYERNGADFFLTGLVPLLLIIATVAIIAVQRFTDNDLPKLPLSWGQITLLASALAALLVVLRVVLGHEYEFLTIEESIDRAPGIYLSALGAIVVTAGSALAFRESGGTLDSLKKDIKDATNRPDTSPGEGNPV